ncbi:family 16 glycoside hydrolase [Halorubellus litoreus]|uniref:Family 16 glycoside hydrolase n=1 Tax=Halorubellus litoreus TaxID=755308 RepID=A0ABD5VPF5_9EURY
MADITTYTPLSALLPQEAIPQELFASDGQNVLDNVALVEYDTVATPDDGRFRLVGKVMAEASLSLPFLSGVELVLGRGSGSNTGIVEVEGHIEWRDDQPPIVDFSLNTTVLSLAVNRSLLKPVELVTNDGDTEIKPKDGTVGVPLQFGVNIHHDQEWSVEFQTPASGSTGIQLPTCEIGDTGVVIDGADIRFNISGDQTDQSGTPIKPESAQQGWQGLLFKGASVQIPDVFEGSINIDGLGLGTGGVTGTIGADLQLDYDENSQTFSGPLSGGVSEFEGGISNLSLELVQNVPAGGSITGQILVPFFDEPVDVDIGIDPEGSLTVSLADDDGSLQTVEKEHFRMKLQRIGIEISDVPAVTVGGRIEPRPDNIEADIDLPPVEVEALTVDAEGNVSVDGGWIDLGDQYQAKIGVATLEITQVGFGKTDDGGRWVGFSGGVKLTDEIAAGASVDGLRFEWGGESGVGVSLDGIGLEFTIPGTLEFKGEVSLEGEVFRGAIDLRLVTLDMTIDAEVIFGKTTIDGEDVRFMGIYVDVGLPGGIPIYITGLAVYGFRGLFASQMEPDKTGEQKWYSVDTDESWYHSHGTKGVQPLGDKWEPAAGAMGFGLGTRIGTLPDAGTSWATDMLLAVVFPGPIVTLQGRGEFLKPGTEVDKEATLQAMALFDGRAGSLTFGIDAQYREGPDGKLLDIAASAAAYYSFSDPSAWYVHIGKKQPKDARVRAEALSVFTANGYFMLNQDRLGIGFWYGYDKEWGVGPLSVTLESWVDSDAVVSFEPAHFTGNVHVHGEVGVSAFGVGLSRSLDVKISGEVFDPFHLKASFSASISTPWPLPDPSATITLEWGPTKDPPTTPAVVDDVGVGHQKLASNWQPTALEADDGNSVSAVSKPSDPPAADAPVVPMDARPNISFAKPVHDENDAIGNPHPPNPSREVIGDPAKNEGPVKVRYGLERLRLRKYEDGSWGDGVDIDGAWAPLSTGQGTAEGRQGTDPDLDQTKLELFARTPFSYGRHTGGAWEDWLSRSRPHYPCPTTRHCHDFDGKTLAEDFTRERSYRYQTERTTFTYEHRGEEPWPRVFLSEPGDVMNPQTLSVSIDRPDRLDDAALLFEETDQEPAKTTDGYPYEIQLALPHAPRSVSLDFFTPKYDVEGEIETLIDQEPVTVEWTETFRDEDPVVVTAKGDNAITFLTIRFKFSDTDATGKRKLGISEICGSDVDLAGPPPESDERLERARDHLEALSQRGRVLEPDTDYRLEVVTKTDARGQGEFDWYEDTSYTGRYYDFHTAGPPGLETPDTPTTGEASSDADDPSKEASGVETLARYVDQTTPATVPADGERPTRPRPVYRTDPIGADFDVDYVDLQYRLARRDLTLHLYDDNDRPVRDARGRIVTVDDEWGTTPTQLLDRATARWIATAGESSCLDLDDWRMEATKQLLRDADERVLAPDTIHEARLKPLLYRERFTPDLGAWTWSNGSWTSRDATWTADGGDWTLDHHDGFSGENGTLHGATLDVRSGVVDALRAGLDTVTLGTGDDAETVGIDAIDATADELTLARQPTASGTTAWAIPPRSVAVQTGAPGGRARWRLTDYPDFGGDQPTTWTDYRLAATVRTRTGGSGGVGLTVRDDGDSYYRIELDTDGTRRIERVRDGTVDERWTTQGAVDAGRDYRLAVEAVGDDLQVLVDDEVVFSVTDPDGPDAGTVALYTRENPDAQFDDVRIDDFRAGAPTAYRFSFTTSLFADARHHLQSYDDVVWAATYPAGSMADVTPGALGNAPDDAEFRAFRSLVDDLPTGDVDRLEVSRLDADGTPYGFAVNAPEPIDWSTVDIDVERGPHFDHQPSPPSALKLTDATPGSANVTALLRETTDLSGTAVEYRRPGDGFAPTLTDGRESLRDSLRRDGPGQWTVDDAIEGASDTTSALVGADADATVLVADLARRDGTVGLTFRYQDADTHYRLVGDADGLQLVRADGTETVLWSNAAGLPTDEERTLRVEVADGRLRGAIDTVPAFDVPDPDAGESLGRTGVVVTDGRTEVERLQAAGGAVETQLDHWAFESGDVDDWTIVDEPPYTTQESDWRIEDGRLRQTSNIYGFVGGDVNAPGTYAITGDDWTDYRLTARVAAGDDDAIGLMFRYQSDGNCYRFSMDDQRSYRRLVARTDGDVELLWSDETTGFQAGQQYLVTIECVDDRIRGYLDGELLFDVTDDTHRTGRVGTYTRANRDANFHDLRVTAPATTWQPYHEFADEPPLPAGTRLSLADTTPSWAQDALAAHRQPSSGTDLPSESVLLRVRSREDAVEHVRQFRDARYGTETLDALRRGDGTGLLLYDATGLTPGAYRLTVAPTSTDNTLESPVTLDLPWDLQE